jgi:glutaredoxin
VSAPAHADAARVVLYTRRDCHLCEVAEQVVADVCGRTGDTWTTVDVDEDADLRTRFTDQVPVTFVDGAQHDFWRVDPARLESALAR